MSDPIAVLCPQCQHPVMFSTEYFGAKVACPECEARFVVDSDYTTKLWQTPAETSTPPPGTASSPGSTSAPPTPLPSQPQLSRNSARKIVAWLLLIALGGIFFHFYRQYQPAEKKIVPESWRAAPKIEDYAIFLQAPDLNDPLALVRYKTVSMLGADFLNNMTDPDLRKVTEVLFDSQVWMEELWSSPIKNPRKTLEVLMLIACYDERGWFLTQPLWRRFGTAMAANDHGSDYNKVMLYRAFQDGYEKELLHPTFDTLAVWEMRYLTDLNKLDPVSTPYLLANHNATIKRYGGACWTVPYRLHNFFGDSIHGSLYYRPWEHNNYSRYERQRLVGGVCGALSHYGSAVAKAHGVPSTPGGQPGHCALMQRELDGRWHIYNYVGAWTSTHFTHFGLSYFSSLDMVEDMYRDPAARLQACREAWRAEALIAQRHPRPQTANMIVELYRGNWRKMPDFATLTPELVLTNHAFNLDFPNFGTHFAARWIGELHVDKSTELRFELASDDGSNLYINNRKVIDNDGLHGMDKVHTTSELNVGTYPLELHYFQATGAKGLNLEWQPVMAFDPEVYQHYQRAVSVNPGDYEIWLALAHYLKQSQEVPDKIWHDWANGVAKGFFDHQQVAWHLLHDHYLPQIQERHPEQLLTTLQRLHRLLPFSDRPRAELFNYSKVVEHHYKLLQNDPEQGLSLFATLMDTHFGSDYMGRVMQWGSDIFLKNTQYASQFVSIIAAVVKEKNPEGQGLQGFLGSSIRSAANLGNIMIFQQLSDLSEQFDPTKSERKLKTVFKEPLLSDKGLLQTSSTSRWDHPTHHRKVIDQYAGTASFHTNKEGAPWAKVILPGMAEVSGIYLENIHSQNDGRQMPLEVWVSEDDANWTKVFEDQRSRNEWLIDLSTSAPRAKFVKVCRTADNRSEYFHLRKIQVYGRKLY